MAKERIEKTLIVLEEAKVRELLQLAQRNDSEEIQHYMMNIFIKEVEAVLRRRCG